MISGNGLMAATYDVVSPLKFPDTKYSAVKSLLTPAKLAGDVAKPVVTGLVVGVSIAAVVMTGGASAAAETAAVVAEEGTETAVATAEVAGETTSVAAAGSTSVETVGEGVTTTLSESGLIAETSFDSTVLATPALEGPVEEAAIEAEVTADVGTSGETRAARILSKIKSAPGKILRSAGKFAKRFAKKVPLFALKNPIVAYVLYELGKSTVNDISDAIREATSNYEAEFGADQKEIEEIIASAIDYVRQFETLEENVQVLQQKVEICTATSLET